MSRTIIPPEISASPSEEAEGRVQEERDKRFAPSPLGKLTPKGKKTSRKPGEEGDSLPEKLVKYVPAETLAFFLPVAALLGPGRQNWLVAALVVAALGTVGYLWLSARSLPLRKRPRSHFYVLATVAFVAWSVATVPNVTALARLEDWSAGVILFLGVFLIPLADGVLNEVLPGKARSN